MISIPIEKIQEFFSDYTDVEYIDKGGFKIVYKGTIGDKKEALKLFMLPNEKDIYSPDELKNELIEESKKRIIRELQILEKSKSPYIVKLGNLKPNEGKIDDYHFICYSEEFLEGENLATLIRNNYKPKEKEIIDLLICLFKAVENIWTDSKAVHRDIKPLNIIKTNDLLRPFVLLDLGIAYIINETPLTVEPSQRLPPGTTRYFAPEMLMPNFRGNLDFRSDLYTIGVTAYEFAAGIHPLAKQGDDLGVTFSRILNEKPKSLCDYRDDFSSEICAFINQLLKKVVALRPSNIKSLIKILVSLL